MPIMPPPQEALLRGFVEIADLEIHVISCTQVPMNAPSRLFGNIRFHLLHVPKMGWLRTGYQGCIRAIRQKLREVQPNVVHGQGTERECALGAIFSGFPNVITIHGNIRAIARSTAAPIGSYWWWMAILERFALPRACGVFCNSRHTESLVRPVARKTWLVPNPLRGEFFDTPFPERSTSFKPTLLNIGTISSIKRQLSVLELARELHREGYGFEFQFIGRADPRDTYAAAFLKQIKIAENEGFARYLGARSLEELIAAMDSASALVHVPSEEAFGLVAAEALARNLKLFGTNIGGLRDIAEEVEGTELFELHDRAALHAAIVDWLRADCPRPRTASLEMKKRYHPEVIASQHADIYRELLSKSS